VKNPARPGDVETFFGTMEPDLKQIIAGNPVVTDDGHCCDFSFQLFKTYMLENSPINKRPRWELYGHGDHWQDFPSWFRGMLIGFLKRNRKLFQKQTPNPFVYLERATPSLKRRVPTSAEILAGMATPRGGWSRATLASWGIPWPPPKGWKKRLEQQAALVEREHKRGPSSSGDTYAK
jgi:hypothetical protein